MQRAWSPVFVLLLACATVLHSECYEERIKAGRERLAEAARQEAEERPQDAEAYLRAHLLDPAWEPKDGPPESPLLVERESWEAVHAAKWRGPESIQAARDLLDRCDRIAPTAAWVPIDRLHLLCADGMARPGFWRKAAELLEEAARREDDLEDQRTFWVRFQDWAAAREKDMLVRLDVSFGPVFFRPRESELRQLSKRAYGAAMARGSADPDLVRLLSAFEQYADKRMRETTDNTEFLFCRVVLQKMMDAKALVAFRSGDDKGLEELRIRLDELLHVGEARDRHAHEEYEAHKGLWTEIGKSEVAKTLTEALDTDNWKNMQPGEVTGSLVALIQRYEEESELRDEMYRATERVAEAMLAFRREELACGVPLLRQSEKYRNDELEGFNCLRRLQDDAASLRAGEIPRDRLDDLLDRTLAGAFPEAEQGRVYGYGAWLLSFRETLLTKGAAPASAIRARLSASVSDRAPILLALRAQGEEIDEVEIEEAFRYVVEHSTEIGYHAYCIVLAERVAKDPAAALEMLPYESDFVMQECEGMIAQTLRQAIGEDHGVALAGWREWLAREK